MSAKEVSKSSPQSLSRQSLSRQSLSRRGLAKLAGLGALAGAVGAADALTGRPAEAATPEASGSGYRVTPHIETYYKLARF